MACTDCGVSPRWPITGISACTSASITATRVRPPSSLTASAPGPDQRRRVADGVVGTQVVAHPRQVAHDQGVGPGPGDRGDVVRHVVDGDLEGVLVAEHGVGHRVADQDQVDAGGVAMVAVGSS